MVRSDDELKFRAIVPEQDFKAGKSIKSIIIFPKRKAEKLCNAGKQICVNF